MSRSSKFDYNQTQKNRARTRGNTRTNTEWTSHWSNKLKKQFRAKIKYQLIITIDDLLGSKSLFTFQPAHQLKLLHLKTNLCINCWTRDIIVSYFNVSQKKSHALLKKKKKTTSQKKLICESQHNILDNIIKVQWQLQISWVRTHNCYYSD